MNRTPFSELYHLHDLPGGLFSAYRRPQGRVAGAWTLAGLAATAGAEMTSVMLPVDAHAPSAPARMTTFSLRSSATLAEASASSCRSEERLFFASALRSRRSQNPWAELNHTTSGLDGNSRFAPHSGMI